MASSMVKLFTSCSLLATLAAAKASPKVVSMPIRGNHDKILQRRDPFSTTIDNGLTLYTANVSFGSPAQTMELQLDTGSSDLWVFGAGACAPNAGCTGGTYDPSKSDNAKLVSKGTFYDAYGTPGSGIIGDYYTDDVTLGGVTVQNAIFAVVTTAKAVTNGILGICFDDQEGVTKYGLEYYNYPDLLKAQGLINTRAYSLYLDSLESKTGSIVWGGYDTSKYTGELITVPMQPDIQTGWYDRFVVALAGMTIKGPKGSQPVKSVPSPGLDANLDSGTTITLVPMAIYKEVADYFGVKGDTLMQPGTVDCSVANMDASIDFTFGDANGPTINVPINQIVGDPQGGQCIFGMGPVDPSLGQNLFGDTLLRSAYVIYDMDNYQISMAQASYNSGSSNIKEIPANGQVASVTASGIYIPASTTITLGASANPSAPYFSTPAVSGSNFASSYSTSFTTSFAPVSSAFSSAQGSSSAGMANVDAAASSSANPNQVNGVPIPTVPPSGSQFYKVSGILSQLPITGDIIPSYTGTPISVPSSSAAGGSGGGSGGGANAGSRESSFAAMVMGFVSVTAVAAALLVL